MTRRSRRRRRGAAGFSLVEMLVALGLAGLVVAGAFQIQGTFGRESRRQDEVADLQQTLRIVMTLLERNIRAAGAGEQAGYLRLTGAGCASTPLDIYTFQYFNNNSNFPPQATGYDTTAGDADNDPDWFRVVLPIAGNNLAIADGANGLQVKGDLTGWQAGDLISVYKPTSQWISCVREITSVNAGLGFVAHASPGTGFPCANPASEAVCNNRWDCCGLSGLGTGGASSPVRRYRNELVFRVLPPVGTSRDAPKLLMMETPIGRYQGGLWQVVAENIEDMQIALIGKNGSVCNSVDSPALCNPALATAVRITLVGRTNNTRSVASLMGGYEDRPQTATTDNFIRRSVTSEIQLRN
jgi:prepilin-type N-terminal cleavage/methylation domain-containing protein